MSTFNKFNSYYFITASKAIIMYSVIIIFVLFNVVAGQECSQMSNCKCKFTNGSVIDLTSLGYHHEARFKNMTPVNDKNYTYYYNPCFPFTLGGACTNVAVCQVAKFKKNEYQNCGNTSNGFVWSADRNSLNLQYSVGGDDHNPRKTNVFLVCNKEATIPTLIVTGESKPGSMVYEMTLTSKCACPNLCHEDHLSAGSVLVILFLIFVLLYLVLGIIHSSLTRGAHGWELIPHYEFWADFPLLVRDGCVFVMSGCKAETAYERI
ncbi:cation-dependent mannose-6-phosphate receptor isoform X2 [Parasteatoda tepidariorum]|uniref:cation-dependent mannose-6-phosphate receptor isoform X2 n=1 Tax=Parasteatoda tepidariorum TaxID=114398 RepID=UPI001C7188E8|nr:cation-dependent mannose-6-phosphate receptor isoform X2 [Parasteatoda tepidariorum]